jgi:hypothetical protein
MNVTISVLADYANVSLDGKLNIMGIFDRIRSAQYPAVHVGGAHIVLRFTANAAERGQTKRFRLVLLEQDGKEIGGIDGEIPIPVDAPLLSTINQIIALKVIELPHAGNYSFHILVNDEPKAEIPFVAELLSDPNALQE